MPVPKFTDPASKIATASTVILLLLATATGVTIWRYSHALAASDSALKARSEEYRSAQAATAFWREREAINEYTEVVKLSPRFPAAQTELANLYLSAGRVDDASREAQSALAIEPANAEAMLVQVRALLAKGNPTAAKPVLTSLAAKYPQSTAVQAQLGILHALENDRTGARKSFEQALALDPTNPEALTGIVTLDLTGNDTKAARARIESALAKQKDNVALLLIAARTYATVGDKALAEKSLKRVIEVSPSTFEAYDLLGRFYAFEGRTPEAMAEFNQIIARQPNSVYAHTMIGILLESQNKREEARKRYEQVIAIDSRAPVAANNLAWIYAETGGNLDVALQLAQTAKAQLPDSPEVSDTLGWIYYKKGLHSQAVAAFKESVDKQPANATFKYHLGLAYAKRGDGKLARQTLEAALKIDPAAREATDARAALAELAVQGS